MPDWSGRDYADVSTLQRALATEAVTALQFGTADRVLDVGCGDGYLTRAVAGMVPDGCVVGVDASPRMIEAAHGGRRGDRLATLVRRGRCPPVAVRRIL